MLIQLLLGQIGGTCMQVAHETVQYFAAEMACYSGNLPCPGSSLIYSLQQWHNLTVWVKEHRI